MEYVIPIIIILIYSTMLSIILKKRIEQTIPIAIVEIILIIYLAGMFDNLKIGVIIVSIIAIIQIAIILYLLCKDKDRKIINRIITPGLIIYIVLSVIAIIINKGRIFEDYDEFNHWGRIIKNMFMNNTYGINADSVVRFNEYPPFTAIFQYLFVSMKKIYSEDIIITAQNILYFSIIAPIFKNIKWNKNFLKTVTIVPLIIFTPMVFYENFYLDILVDGILGVMFATLIYYGLEQEENYIFKFLKIFSTTIMLTLTKTTGIALAILGIIIIIIKEIKNKKELLRISAIIILCSILVLIWYVKVDGTQKRWDFNQYIKVENKKEKDMVEISKTFIQAVFVNESITDKEFTFISAFLLIILLNYYVFKNKRQYKYYSYAMLISIIIYMIFLLITYITIFDLSEAQLLTCFSRYSSTILLANVIFQIFMLQKDKMNFEKILILLIILGNLLPNKNIYDKYIQSNNYIATANVNRDIRAKLKNYTTLLKDDDKILYISGITANLDYLESLNQYEIMPIKITNAINGVFKTKKDFLEILKNGQYTHVFIYRISEESKNKIKEIVEDQYIGNDILYKVNNSGQEMFLERVKVGE